MSSNLFPLGRYTKEYINAEVEINGYPLQKNKVYPKLSRYVGIENTETFVKLFIDKAGQSVPIKLPKSAHLSVLTTNSDIPKIGKVHSK